jgi:glycosyltransferase involved in cell wall biosynthesis
MPRPLIALLGRKDEPTDAVEEYCRYLGSALEAHDFQLQIRRVPWEIHGWQASRDALRLQAAAWRDTWVLVQYTALAWSARGFPQRLLRVLHILKRAGARIGVVYHDAEPFHGARFIDRLRRSAQLRTMRRILQHANLTIFTVPLDKVTWLGNPPANAHFIPVGANLPISFSSIGDRSGSDVPTIGVFGITGGEAGAHETKLIVAAVRHAAAKLGKLRVSVFGRNAELREADLRRGFQDLLVDVSVEGVVEPQLVVERLSACDVLLFVRGEISSRRGSAIAGIACGLPVIAFSGPGTGQPITDAGVLLVPHDEPDELSAALVRVLADSAYRAELAARSRAVYQSHLSWPAIAASFAAVLSTKSSS